MLERFATRGLDDRLDAQLILLSGAVRPDGTLDATAARRLPDFATERGWSWRVRGAGGQTWSSGGMPALHSGPRPFAPRPAAGRGRAAPRRRP